MGSEPIGGYRVAGRSRPEPDPGPVTPRPFQGGPKQVWLLAMKTLTELSGILVRKAAAAVLKAQPPPASAPEPVTPGLLTPGEGAPAADASAAALRPDAAPSAPPAESQEVKAALDAAVAAATGLSGDRLARLRDAVQVASGQLEDVRLIRVFGPEEPVPGAKALNGFQYLVDLAPSSMRQEGTPPRKERLPGAHRRREGSGQGTPSSGGFSMDSLKDDRKGARGARGKPRGR